ncbi:MAG: S-layer homology domain-containing protein, partial [Clostridia bacterium]|nr:S-layer homology domain-containing protein [Clostridia bacterium]
IADILSKTPAKTTNDLLDAVSKALKSDTDSGSGGSGGSGGGGGSSTTITPVATNPTGTPGSAGLVGFKDLHEAEWARTAVSGLANLGIIAGDEKGNFRPNDYVTREEYVKMLVVAAGKHNIYATCDFEDVPKDAWYHSYVASAKQFGLTSGINEKEFGTGMALTRQDMAVLSLKAKGNVQMVRDDVIFADAGEIADYAKDAVSKLYMSGVVNGTGDGKFAPRGQATRAECAQIIYNLFVK